MLTGAAEINCVTMLQMFSSVPLYDQIVTTKAAPLI